MQLISKLYRITNMYTICSAFLSILIDRFMESPQAILRLILILPDQ